MQPDTNGVHSAAAEEPPSKNVRIARRGVAAGITTVVTGLLLSVYASGHHWDYRVGTIIFFAAVLVTAAVTSVAVVTFGYGAERSARHCAAANVELVEQFRNVMAEVEVGRLRRERRTADRLEEVAEQLERDRTILRLRTQEPQRTIADVPRQKRRRRGRQSEVRSERGADNVIPLRARRAAAADALRRLTERIDGNQDA
jgi:hypothetical protein